MGYFSSYRALLRQNGVELKPVYNLANLNTACYLEAHMCRLVHDIGGKGDHLVTTQGGQARAVLQDIHGFEQTQQTIALLRVLALVIAKSNSAA